MGWSVVWWSGRQSQVVGRVESEVEVERRGNARRGEERIELHTYTYIYIYIYTCIQQGQEHRSLFSQWKPQIQTKRRTKGCPVCSRMLLFASWFER